MKRRIKLLDYIEKNKIKNQELMEKALNGDLIPMVHWDVDGEVYSTNQLVNESKNSWEELDVKTSLKDCDTENKNRAWSWRIEGNDWKWLRVPIHICENLVFQDYVDGIELLPLFEKPNQNVVFTKRQRISLNDIWIDEKSANQLIFGSSNKTKPHTAFISEVITTGMKRADAWKKLCQMSSESKGQNQVKIDGYGYIFLKRDKTKPKSVLRYKDVKFESSNEGDVITQGAFNTAWTNERNLKRKESCS